MLIGTDEKVNNEQLNIPRPVKRTSRSVRCIGNTNSFW